MDTSKEYIRMCEKALEIQRRWRAEEGDWFNADKIRCLACDWFCVNFEYPEIMFAMTEDIEILIPNEKYPSREIKIGKGKFIFKRWRNVIWLPRQDQLQEMVFELDGMWQGWVDLFHNWKTMPASEGHDGGAVVFNSMEQLWLAFVMKEKYGKIWNGKEWICSNAKPAKSTKKN